MISEKSSQKPQMKFQSKVTKSDDNDQQKLTEVKKEKKFKAINFIDKRTKSYPKFFLS